MSATLPPPRTDLRIRPLRPADLTRVLEIERQAFSTPWKQSTFESLLRRTDTDMLGAVRQDRLVGYAIAWTVTDQSELGNVAVAEEARGLGLGRMLVLAMIERLRHRRSAECFLEVRESNHVAQRLYHSLGFELVGRRRAYYSAPLEDARVMRLGLDGE
jgi:[ribosomal protein S18]-alanine N-acetyltransferase